MEMKIEVTLDKPFSKPLASPLGEKMVVGANERRQVCQISFEPPAWDGDMVDPMASAA